MGKPETANLLAILAAGRQPQWVAQATVTGAPSSAGSGNHLENGLLGMVDVKMRAEVHRRTALVTVDVVDLTGTYTVEINGNAVVYDAAADGAANLQDVLDGIAAEIMADVVVNLLVSATVTDEDEDTFDDTVKIVGLAEADYTVDFSTTGTGELAVEADASTASVRFYVTYGGTNAPDGWRHPEGEEYDLTFRGLYKRVDTAGLDRLYVEVFDVVGTGDGVDVTYAPSVSLGPCVVE